MSSAPSNQPIGSGGKATAGQIRSWLDAIAADDQWIEIRAFDLDGRDRKHCQIFSPTERADLVKLALSLSGRASGVYFTLNPIKPNTVGSAKAGDIARRRLLLVDCDPIRPETVLGISRSLGFGGKASASDDEKAAAVARAREIREYLTSLGWPDPIDADSGNGAHLLYLIDLPNNAASTKLVKATLTELARRFDDADVEIDQKVSDAPRITKLYGTMARKGPVSEERPHRPARIVSIPPTWSAEPVTREQLQEFARPEPEPAVIPFDRPAPRATRPDDGKWTPEARAVAYLQACQPARSGSKGHSQTFKVACKVGPGFDLAPETTFKLIMEVYNPTCEPPWSEKEVRHKINEAYSKETNRGWLRDAPRKGEIARESRIAPPSDPPRQRYIPDADDLPPIGPPDDGGQAEPPQAQPAPPPRWGNYDFEFYVDEEGRNKTRNFPHDMGTIDGNLDRITGGWPKRVKETLFVPSSSLKPVFLGSTARLFAWIDKYHARVDWTKGSRFITQERLFESLRMTVEQFDTVEVMPHQPQMPNAYYMHRELPPPSGKLDELVARFSPASEVDRQLIKAMIMTPLWGGSPGSRPAFVVTGPDKGDIERGRGIGKSTLLDLVANNLYGGSLAVSTNDDMGEIKTRLLSAEGVHNRIMRLDNVKSHQLSWAEMEDMITASEISGRALYVGEGSRPNTLTWFITVNGASLSKDLAQRVVIIKLQRPSQTPKWQVETEEFMAANRWEILADIAAILAAEPGPLKTLTRWSPWEAAVLSKMDRAEECQREFMMRQGNVDADNENRDQVLNFIRDRIEAAGMDPDAALLKIPSVTMADMVNYVLKKRFETNQCTSFVKGLAISELLPARETKFRGWIWNGCRTEEGEPTFFQPDKSTFGQRLPGGRPF